MSFYFQSLLFILKKALKLLGPCAEIIVSDSGSQAGKPCNKSVLCWEKTSVLIFFFSPCSFVEDIDLLDCSLWAVHSFD